MGQAAPEASATTTPELIRGIGRWGAVALMINAIVGAGIFGLPSRVHALAGVHALWAFAICALAAGLAAACFAEVSSRFTGTGGPYLYAHHTFGRLPAFCVGWTMWLARLASIAVIVNVTADYAGFFWEPLSSGTGRPVLMGALLGGFAVVNLAGVRSASGAINAFTVGKLTPMVAFVLIGAFFIEPARLIPSAPFETGVVGAAVVQLAFAFGGFESATVVAGEVRDPRRDVPFAILVALLGVTVLYMAIQVVCIGTLPRLAQSARPLADASTRMFGPAGGAVMAAAAVISTVGTIGGSMLIGSRQLYALAEHDQLPRGLGGVHPITRTPQLAILLTTGLSLVLAVTGSFAHLLSMAVITRLVAYVSTAAALPVLRRRDGPPPFRIPVGWPISIAAVVIGVLLGVNAGAGPLRDVGIATAVGLMLHGAHRWVAARRRVEA